MRFIFIIIALFLFSPNLLDAQPRYIHKFINKQKKKSDAFAFTIPGWLIKTGTKIATKEIENDPDAMEAMRLLNYVKKMRMVIIEGNNPVEEGEIQNLMMKMKNDSYEDYLIVRHKESRIHFMAREKNNVIKDLFFILNDEDTFVLITMKTNITVEQLEDLDLQFLEKEQKLISVIQ